MARKLNSQSLCEGSEHAGRFLSMMGFTFIPAALALRSCGYGCAVFYIAWLQVVHDVCTVVVCSYDGR